MVVVVFFSVVEVTLGASVRDASFGAAVFDAAIVLGLAATFDAVVDDVVVVFLIGATLPAANGFFVSVGLAFDGAADDLAAAATAPTVATAATAVVAIAAAATSGTKLFSTTGSGSRGADAATASDSCKCNSSMDCAMFGISSSVFCSLIISVDDTSGSMCCCGSSVSISGCSCCTNSSARYGSGSDVGAEKSDNAKLFVSGTGAHGTNSLASTDRSDWFITSDPGRRYN